jgi:hypothetical protein
LSSLDKELKSLSQKLEEVIRRLDYIETVLMEGQKYPEVAQVIGGVKAGALLYGEPLKMIRRLLAVKRFIDRNAAAAGDEVSRIILNALATKDQMNISELTRAVAQERGTASRITVRNRVRKLLELGIIEKAEGFSYRLVE